MQNMRLFPTFSIAAQNKHTPTHTTSKGRWLIVTGGNTENLQWWSELFLSMPVFHVEFFRSKMLLLIRSAFPFSACSPYSSPKRHSRKGKKRKKVLWSNKHCILYFPLGDVPSTSLREQFWETCVPRINPVFPAFDRGELPTLVPCNYYFCQWKWSRSCTVGNATGG